MHEILWKSIRDDLEKNIDRSRFETWVAPLSVSSNSDATKLILCAPNQFICDFLSTNYKDSFLSISKKLSLSVNEVDFKVENNLVAQIHEQEIQVATNTSSSPQKNLYPLLNKRFSFDSFIVGSGNEFAKSAALAVAEAPGKTKFNPLLFYGGVGLGKTHLLQAIGNFILSLGKNYKVSYVTSEEFYLEFIDAIKTNTTKKFTEKYRTSDILLVDDLQFFAGKESTQEEFFYVFNTLYQNGKQLVLTSDLPPSALQGLQDRLVSRFQWGLCIDIQPPNLETRVAILKKKAEEDSLNIPETVLYYIAEHVSSNIRELEGVVIRLLAYASITKTDITIDLVTSVLKKSYDKGNSRISIEEVIEKVANYYKVPINNIREKNRRKEVAICRQIAMYITKSITNHSLKTIGLNFGGRDHSTVIHAVQTIEKLKKTDETLLRDINYIISMLKN